MRNALLFATAFVLFACNDIAPVEQIDLCNEDKPPSNECPQCQHPPFAKECPKCNSQHPVQGCENADHGSGAASGGGGDGSSGTNGSGGATGSGGASGGGGEDGGGGGTVAMMDAGPDAAIDGGHACSGCPDDRQLCLGSECVQCLKEKDCGGTLHCDTLGTHNCVACVNDKQCQAQGMVCDEVQHTCVPCVLDSDCKDPKLARCANDVCVPCSDDSACEGREGLTHCDTATGSPTKGRCVECLAHGDCKNPKPQCNSKRECDACSDTDEACVDRNGTTVCDDDDWSDTHGQCVQCTGTKYAKCKVDGTDYVCDSAKRTCSTDINHVKSKAEYCEGCISDAECIAGSACVELPFGTSTFGPFCLPIHGSAGCASAANLGLRPYSLAMSATSIDHGQETDYCFPPVNTTCAGIANATQQDPCENNSQCGEPNQNDGICVDSGAAQGKCSYSCDNDWDCLSGVNAFKTCGIGGVCQP